MHHTCSTCSPGEAPDCTTCKLAFLTEKDKRTKPSGDKRSPQADLSDGDYSISEELTKEENSLSILYLVIAAAAVLAFVVLFAKLMA